MNAPEARAAVSVAARAGRRGVILANVGTPAAPTPEAVRAYLREFLGDPKVVDLPGPARWLLLNLVILPFRPARSAHAYRQIWGPDGSPLLVHARAQRAALAARLPEAAVEIGMRYGSPSLADAAAALAAVGASDLTLVPMFPQAAGATVDTTVEAFQAVAPGAQVVAPFFAAPGFVAAAAARVRRAVAASGAEHVVLSYHGLPVRQLAGRCEGACRGSTAACPPLGPSNLGCYRAQCYATSTAIAREAGVLAHSSTAFQSRLRGTRWLGPHTFDALAELGRRGVKRVAVACPSFVADCLETLEEIGGRGAAVFRASGGEHLELVPAVNDEPAFIDELAQLVRRQWESAP